LLVFALGFSVSLASCVVLDDAALLKANENVERALLEADKPALAPLLADDFTYIHAGAGVQDDKASWLKTMPNLQGLYRARSMDHPDVRVYGDTGLIAGDLTVEYDTERFPQLPTHYVCHQLRVFRKDAGQWKLAYLHVTFRIDNLEQEIQVMRYIDQIKQVNAVKPRS